MVTQWSPGAAFSVEHLSTSLTLTIKVVQFDGSQLFSSVHSVVTGELPLHSGRSTPPSQTEQNDGTHIATEQATINNVLDIAVSTAFGKELTTTL